MKYRRMFSFVFLFAFLFLLLSPAFSFCEEKVGGTEKEKGISSSLPNTYDEKERARREIGEEPPEGFPGLLHAWHIHKKGLLLIGASIAMLCGIIALLSVNIVKRKRAEESYRQKELQLRHLSDNLQKGFIYQLAFDSRGTFREVRHISAGISSVLGFSPEEIHRDPAILYRQVHPEDRQRFMDAEAEDLADLSLFDFQGRFIRRDNSVTWLHVISTGHRNKGGLIIRDGLAMDISEHKHLLSERERLATAIQQTPETVIITDTEGIILYVNPAFSAKTGYSPEEVVGKKADTVLGNQEKDTLLRAMWHTLKNGSVWRGYFLNKHKNGTLFTEDATISPVFDEQGNIANYVSFQRDITRELSLQSAKEDLESLVSERTAALQTAMDEAIGANRAKSAFLANMSHEIRTPLNAILGFASILERDPSLSSKQKDYLRTINRSGLHLLSIINDILNMSKIEAGKTMLKKSSFSLSSLLKDLESTFRSPAESKGLLFYFERSGEIPSRVLGDEGKLRQVFVNILGNALKFTEKGNITVRIDVAKDGEEDSLLLAGEIEDTGPGISEEDLRHVFDAFRQAGSEHHAGGTGLGLSISQHLVRLMKGELTAKSTLGEGSCFSFWIPLQTDTSSREEENRKPSTVSGIEQEGKNIGILIADDAPENRQVLRAFLEPFGFTLREASNGEEALNMMENWTPDIVLMDMRMPVLDGYETIRRMKRDPEKSFIPVIAVTARSFEEEVEKILETGANDYLPKPFSPESLFAILEKHTSVRFIHTENARESSSEKGTSLSREQLAGFPENLLAAMRQAVRTGDMVALEKLVVTAEGFDVAAAQGLRELAEEYDYEKLSSLLE